MAFRTNHANVANIIDVDEEDDVSPFIESANMLVTDVCTNSGYSDAKLELIERWLSAHFYAIMRPRAFLEQADVIREQIESKVGLGLDVTRYGQQAKLLDTAGNLAALDNTNDVVLSTKRTLLWLGRNRTGDGCSCPPETE